LAVHIEKIVRNFSRYHKYTLGTDLRNKSRGILEKIIEANNARDDRAAHLLELRQELESFKVLARLCHKSGGFASTHWGFRGGEVWPELEGCEHPLSSSGRARFIIVRPSRLRCGAA